MNNHRLLRIWSLLALVSITVACNPFDNSSSPSTSTSTSTTDTFSGSLAPNSSLIFTFTVTTAGNVGITLTTVSPATTAPLTLGVGPSSGGTCAVTNSTSGAVAGGSAQLSANEAAGTYCVKVSDTGNLTTTATVTVTVAHS